MLEKQRAVRGFAEAAKLLGQGPDSAEFSKFWQVVTQRLARSLTRKDQEYPAEVRASLRALVETLENTAVPGSGSHLRERMLGAPACEIAEQDLPGARDDPSTPLGFYRWLAPTPQDDRRLQVFVPHSLSILETSLHGGGTVAAFVRSLHPDIPADILDGVTETAERLAATMGTRLQELCRLVVRATDDLVLGMPFLALFRPVDFYQHGRRFYAQGDLDYYKCGVTSGFIIPEDFYGSVAYETHGPGITADRGLAPGNFSDHSVGENVLWNEILTEATRGSHAGEVNPYRPIYFDSALCRLEERGGRFKNLIDVEQTGAKLRERAEKWQKLGKLDSYLTDAATLLAHFLVQDHVDVHFVRSLDTAWRERVPRDGAPGALFADAPTAAPYLTSLLSDRVCVYTARGELSGINRGFWVNPAVLEFIEPSRDYGWELIPYYLLGLSPDALKQAMKRGESGPTYWLSRYVQDPTRAIFRDENRVKLPSRPTLQVATELAWRIVEEMLRPDLFKLAHPQIREFLTLRELSGLFDRSYGRLRHWVAEFNLGAYSVQAHDHRFTREGLVQFVRQELTGKRGFSPERVGAILSRIEAKFRGT